MFVDNYKKFKREIINQYELYCLEYAETRGTPQCIDDYINAFINNIDYELRYNSGVLEEVYDILNDDDIDEIEKQIEHMLIDYEYND